MEMSKYNKKYKILFGGDLHKRPIDLSTIKGYTEVNYKIQCDVMNELRDGGYTHFISLGDWFDEGYGSDTAAALAHTDIDKEMSGVVNGNFYGLIGNHIKIRMDSNPELFLIQPHPYYKSRHKIYRDYQIIRTPKELILNGVQICFMHWNHLAESARDYKAMIDTNCHYHIGLYHTPYIIPANFMAGLNMYTKISDNSSISAALDDIELAIVGDIHKPLGTFTINKVDGKSTTMIVPGSMTVTDSGKASRHDKIDMPVIEIDEDGNVSLSYFTLNLRLDELEFMEKIISDEKREKLKSIRGNNKVALYEDLEAATFVGTESSFLTLNRYMKEQGYTDTDKKLIKSVMNSPDDIQLLTYMYKEGLENGI